MSLVMLLAALPLTAFADGAAPELLADSLCVEIGDNKRVAGEGDTVKLYASVNNFSEVAEIMAYYSNPATQNTYGIYGILQDNGTYKFDFALEDENINGIWRINRIEIYAVNQSTRIVFNSYFTSDGENTDLSGGNFVAGEDENAAVDIDAAYVEPIADQSFTGDEIKPAITVKYAGSTLEENTDYTAEYQDNIFGVTAKVILSGIGAFAGTKEVTFKIIAPEGGATVTETPAVLLPKKTAIKSLKGGKKRFTVKYRRISGVDGYVIQYSLKKSMKGAKTVKVKGAKNAAKTVKKLKKKNTYYVRVRTYKVINGNIFFSKYTKIQKVKTK